MQRSNSKSAGPSDDKAMKDAVNSLPYQELLERKEEIQQRLEVITIEPIKAKKPSNGNANNKNRRNISSNNSKLKISTDENININNNEVPLLEKTTDVHWDFTLKEMMWLATDFQVERKRQMSLAKKIAAGVRQYHKTRESRRVRELAEAELKRRRLAGRIGREVRGWWIKIERVIAYKQKCSADEERRKAMNRQLVNLVKQTEKYTESLIRIPEEEEEDMEEETSVGSSGNSSNEGEASPKNGKTKRKRKNRKKKRHVLTIEEALAMGERTRRSKSKVVDYNRIHLDKQDDHLYGESTASDSGSDASYSPDDSDEWTDDETTLLEAELQETRERLREKKQSAESLENIPYTPDPKELEILNEERNMPIEALLERYTANMDMDDEIEPMDVDSKASDAEPDPESSPQKKVTFAPNPLQETMNNKERETDPATITKEENSNNPIEESNKTETGTEPTPTATEEASAKYDADDDGDASDVEDFVDLEKVYDARNAVEDRDDDGSEEFEADQDEVDDETTLIQEESLPQEMSAKDEIELLKAENEMSVEELRKLYAGVLEDTTNDPSDEIKTHSSKESSTNLNGTSSQPSTGPRGAATTTSDAAEEESSDNNDDEGSSDDDGSEEFVADKDEVDDETTLAQEEALPREMSAEEEINLLKAENEMSIDELRKRYDGAFQEDGNEKSASESEGEGSKNVEERSSSQPAVVEGMEDSKDADEDKDKAEEGSENVAESSSSKAAVAERMEVSKDANEDREGESREGKEGEGSEEPAEGSAPQADLVEGGEECNDANDDNEGEEEFVPAAGGDVDDETTIEAEEKLGRDMSYEDELKLLKDENEIPVEQLRAMYAAALAANSDDGSGGEDDASVDSSDDDTRGNNKRPKLDDPSLAEAMRNATEGDGDDDGEFQPNAGDAIDDETTIEAEEKLGRDMSYEDEIALLKKENEMSVEELRAMYAGVLNGDSGLPTNGANNSSKNAESDLALLVTNKMQDDNTQDEDPEFVADVDEVDDETTLEAEERLGREMSPEEELAMLKRESEVPIESLYEMHRKMELEQAAQESAGASEDQDTADEASVDSKKRKGSEDEEDALPEKAFKRSKREEADEGLAAIQALEKSAERARKTLASRPFLLASWVKLRAYQQTGLNWLVSLQSRRLNGILADEMGLGKTLQTISLLAYLASYKGIWGPHLVVVPTSVIVNWETELKRFCPGLKALCYYGSAKRRKELRSGWTKTNWYHVVVTSYQLAVQDAFAFKRKRWYYLILDEAQNIKNFQSQRWQTLINFNTQRRLLLTGTPLQNNLMELWSLLHFLMPYIFRSRKEFSFWFSNPMNNVIEGTANQNEEMIARLHGIIRPFVLRRLKKDVETQLPGKFEHIIKCPLSRRQMFFYEEFMSRSSTRQAMKKGGNYMGMMNVLMQLRKVVNHPDLFEPRSVVTPFVLEPLLMSVPASIVCVLDNAKTLSSISRHLLSPLWCGSTSTPSIDASLNHDEIHSTALKELEDKLSDAESMDSDVGAAFDAPSNIPPALAALLREIEDSSKANRKSTLTFQKDLNSRKCRSPAFAFPSRLLRAVEVQPHPVYRLEDDLLSTPSQLLAARQNQEERAEQADDMIKNFVVCVPKAGAPRPILDIRTCENDSSAMEEMLLRPVETYLRPFRKAHARLTSFFPDKKLIQFDAGKLQTLAELLHDLKRGGHRVLIFTQMSKMLDILEAFLNLNGHTYVRLDGSTGVDRRQRLMDRFNNDTKIFSFILSTRSGGMGINLTGADTVIFYDSDWNPAMDAQAQDRAHRIGQTREVHIYRLITEHSIEENILIKAQQKRNLDIIVMDKGKFDGSTTGKAEEENSKPNTNNDQSDVFTKGGLRAILGVGEDLDDEEEIDNQNGAAENGREEITREQMEAAMTNLEDQDDVIALKGAQKEAAEELMEFDETVELKESDNEGDDGEGENKASAKGQASKNEEPASEQKNEEEELAKEFEAWQDNVGLDTSALEASLSPTEKYGLNFRQEIDPFYSVFAIMEERRRIEAENETKDEIDIDQIEHEKAMEEKRAIEDGDLLATRPRPEDLVRQRNLYKREKARLKAGKKRRTLTGENWEVREDARSKKPFWYNTDTGEALWDKPLVLLELEAEEIARQKLWAGLPLKPLVHVMSFLLPFPDRVQCTKVCRQWRLAANDISFVRHVYPVEMGALARDEKHMAHNHYRTLAEALSIALPGDTLELGDGHYWVNEPGLSIDFPLKLVGDENNASNVVIEMSGTITWKGTAGWVEGITFRRPKISSGEGSKDDIIRVESGGRVDIVHSVIDNTGSHSASAVTFDGSQSGGRWKDVIVSGGNNQGIKMTGGANLLLKKCIIRGNSGDGLNCSRSDLQAEGTKIVNNGGFGAVVQGGTAKFFKCHFARNRKGILAQEEDCQVDCSQNTATADMLAKQTISGFRHVNQPARLRGE